MNRTIKAIIGVAFILVITFSAISICQNVGRSLKVDVTEEKIYTLADGTKNILGKLKQPLKLKLFYAKTAALKGPDQIRYFNNYYEFVKDLLEEYVAASNGMVELEVIDPRPFSEDEALAMRSGLKRFMITQEDNFFFGLVLQTQYGVEKVIPFFTPDRQNFVEYDISSLIDSVVTKQKKRVGILSSLPVTGDDVSGYMAQMMRAQGKSPKQPWVIMDQIKAQFSVVDVPADTNEISGVDVLLVIHPKGFPLQTLFAIDQFVLKGGRTVIFEDPFCVVDEPDQMAMQMGQGHSASSDINMLTRNWGLEMPADEFAGDIDLAVTASMGNDRPEKVIGFLELNKQCFNPDSVVTTNLKQVRVLFSGVLNEVAMDPNQGGDKIERMPLLMTTDRGNSWSATVYELSNPNPAELMRRFYPGNKPVVMGYLVTGKFKSSFPDGIEVEDGDRQAGDDTFLKTKKQTGLTEASEDCVVAVFADVDFISDLVAYEKSFFGMTVSGDNSTLLLNLLDDLSGSSDLISIRSRGNFKRPFTLVDKIETQAEQKTMEEENKIDNELAGFQNELQKIVAEAMSKGQTVIDNSILQKRKEAEYKIRQLEREKNLIKLERREQVDRLGRILLNINMLAAPAVILVIAVFLGIFRSVRKRHYISHASDS